MRRGLLAIVVLGLMAAGAAADVKYTQEMAAAPGTPLMRFTVYIKGQLERRDTEMPGGMGTISTITDCGKKQMTTVNGKCSAYYTSPLESGGAAAQAPAAAEPTRRGGVVRVTNEVRDTGEKHTMLGREAHHVIVKMKMEPGPGACLQGQTEMEMDLWVANLPGAHPECRKVGEPPVPPRGGCIDKYDVVNRGSVSAMMGVPIKQTITTAMPNGQKVTMTMEVKELSTENLDASLFEPPAGSKQASSMQEVYTCGMGPMMTGGNMAEAMKRAREQARSEQQAEQPPLPQPSAAGEVGQPVARPRSPGRPRIGVVTTDKSGKVQPDALTSQIIREIGNIGGFEGVGIEAREPAAIQTEAADKKCDFLLYGNVAEAKSGMPKIGGLLGRAAGRGGSVEPTQSLRVEYRLALVQPFDQQVARDTISESQQSPSMDPAVSSVAAKLAERATSDARRAARK